jgi:hypothetical protein
MTTKDSLKIFLQEFDLGMYLVASPWFWIVLLLVVALLSLGAFSTFQHYKINQLKKSKHPPAPELASNLFSADFRPANDIEQPQSRQDNPPSRPAAPVIPAPAPALADPSQGCIGNFPAPYETYQPLRRFNSFRTPAGATAGDSMADRTMKETVEVLQHMKEELRSLMRNANFSNAQAVRVRQASPAAAEEGYYNVRRPMPPLPAPRFEQLTSWKYRDYTQGAASLNQDQRDQAGRRLPPPPPIRQTECLEMQLMPQNGE